MGSYLLHLTSKDNGMDDYNDAEAIAEAMAEAAQRPNMLFVAIKSVERQDIQNFHCQRERTKKERTALVNQVRGLLAEYGVVIDHKGRFCEIHGGESS